MANRRRLPWKKYSTNKFVAQGQKQRKNVKKTWGKKKKKKHKAYILSVEKQLNVPKQASPFDINYTHIIMPMWGNGPTQGSPLDEITDFDIFEKHHHKLVADHHIPNREFFFNW